MDIDLEASGSKSKGKKKKRSKKHAVDEGQMFLHQFGFSAAP